MTEKLSAELQVFKADVKADLFIMRDKIEGLKISLAKIEDMVKENEKDITGVANALRVKIEKTEDELKNDIIERTKSSNNRMYEWIKWAGMALIGGLVGHYGVKK